MATGGTFRRSHDLEIRCDFQLSREPFCAFKIETALERNNGRWYVVVLLRISAHLDAKVLLSP